MPFYEYECSACKFYVEALQKISDTPLKQCPSCKKQTLKRLVSAPVFRLKGGGWYETDFKSEKEDKRNLAASEEAPEAKPAESKEAKPEATQESKQTVKASDTKQEKPARKKTVARKPAKPVKSKARPQSTKKATRKKRR